MYPLLAVAVALVAWTASDWGPVAAAQTSELRWAGDAEGGAPFVEADPQDPSRVVGFEVDIAELIGRALGRRPRFIQTGFTSLDASVARGDSDIGLSGLEDLPARRARMAVTVPYYEFREILTVRAADRDRFRTLADLRGRRVATLGATLAYDLLVAAEAEHGVTVVTYEDDVHPYSDLALGRVDAVLLDEVLAKRGVGRDASLVNQERALGAGTYVGVLAPGQDALRDRVDVVLEQAMRDGRLETIFRRWNMWNDDQPRLYARVLAGEFVGPSEAAAGPRRGNEATGSGLASGGASTLPSDADPTGDWSDSDGSAWALTLRYLPSLIRAAAITAVLSCAAMAIAILVGLLIACGRVYGGRPLRAVLIGYVEVVRGTPLLLQLFVIYFGLASVVQLPAFLAALIGLGLNYAAYESEIYRGALEAVPQGQLDAARALGLTNRQTLQLVRGPQAFQLALAPMTNDFIALLKDSSLVSVITVVELTKQTSILATNIGSWVVPGALCAAMYLAMSLPLARVARRIEKGWSPR